MKTKSDPKKKRIEFGLLEPDAKYVFLSGDFNQWNTSSHPMKKAKNGVWKLALNLDPGEYEYRLFIDGEWKNDPNCHSCVPNPFGTSNCRRIVM